MFNGNLLMYNLRLDMINFGVDELVKFRQVFVLQDVWPKPKRLQILNKLLNKWYGHVATIKEDIALQQKSMNVEFNGYDALLDFAIWFNRQNQEELKKFDPTLHLTYAKLVNNLEQEGHDLIKSHNRILRDRLDRIDEIAIKIQTIQSVIRELSLSN